MSNYSGKYALAKHETLALKCEELEKQLKEADMSFTNSEAERCRLQNKLIELERLKQSRKDQTELIRLLRERLEEAREVLKLVYDCVNFDDAHIQKRVKGQLWEKSKCQN